MENSDVAALLISFSALAVSLGTFVTNKKQDKRELFLRVHERLIDPEIQRGRMLLYERVKTVDDAARLHQQEPENYQLINRSLGMFDIFAMYVLRGYIDRELALQEWGHAFARVFQRALPFIEYRLGSQTWTTWTHLRVFGDEAVRWHEARLAEDSSSRTIRE
ncbi:DUF4760 domain-containing protein [Knoellia sp. CPCC 206435]|uniref:DUF4760 domain-containing protein n=1 Tax=Knoellia terrae TaxID=3404797 RepID=UPI003B429F3B